MEIEDVDCSVVDPKIIAIYNYKGGVAKTTVTMNLGASFAENGHRTLLVDADPQANLSIFLFGSREEETESTDEDNYDELLKESQWSPTEKSDPRIQVHTDKLSDIENNYNPEYKITGSTLYDALFPIFGGNYGGVQPAEITSVEGNENLFLLKGDPRIIKFEPSLAVLRPFTTIQTVGAFRYLLLLTARKYQIDRIVVDLGPSSGELNKCFVMTCDYILPPAFADNLSLSSVNGLLTSVLTSWYEWIEDIKRREIENLTFIPDAQKEGIKNFLLPQQAPKLLPILFTSYKIYKSKITMGQSLWILECQRIMEDIMNPKNNEFYRIQSHYARLKTKNGEYVITLCCNLGAVHDVAHHQKIPFIFLSPTSLSAKSHKNLLSVAKSRYSSLVSALDELFQKH